MNYLNNEICSAIFSHQADFTTGPVSTVNHGLKSLRDLVTKIWNIIPPDIRNYGNLKNLREKLSIGFLKIVLVSYFLITSIALGMPMSHIFGTSHSLVL